MRSRLFTYYVVFFIGFAIDRNSVQAQCTPAAVDNCQDANVLCSLDEVNGYSCKNSDYTNPTGCTPLCPSGGASHNTSWWAFVTNGGKVCVTITFSNCSVNGTGVQFGIWGDCDCGESIFCDPSCTGSGTRTACGELEPCKTYFLFVDGCSGDVCDFILTTKGGSAPTLPPLGKINGLSAVCKGACAVKHSIDFESSKCEAVFQWTLDGVELDQYGKEVTNDFPDEGIFILCATAIIGNPEAGSICDQEGPKCISIKVGNEPKIRKDKPRWLCYENLPFMWHQQKITDSGEYTQHFDSINCCPYDSVVFFLPLKKPKSDTAYFLGCVGEIYKDSRTDSLIKNCQSPIEIVEPKTSNIYRCDSSYYLFATLLDDTVYFKTHCLDTNSYLEATAIDRTCAIRGYQSKNFYYRWYKKNDPLKISLSENSKLAIVEADEFCLDLTLESTLDTLTKSCTHTFCETIDELQIIPPQICPMEDNSIHKENYSKLILRNINLPQNLFGVEWSVQNGKILTPENGKDSSNIEVHWDSLASMKSVCVRYRTECGWSPKCCVPIQFLAINNYKVLEDEISIVPNPVNSSFKILYSGPVAFNSAELLNLSGQTIFTWKGNTSNSILNLPKEIVPGMYFILLKSSRQKLVKKMIVL